MLVLRAKYVFPIDGPPLRDGVVAIEGDRIVAVGDSSSSAIRDLLPSVVDLGDVAILPGFVNAHTHLELSDFRQPLGEPGMSFTMWIVLVVLSQRARGMGQIVPTMPIRPLLQESLAVGIEESKSAGVTTIGDIASGMNLPSYKVRRKTFRANPLSFQLVEFLEAISLKRRTVELAVTTIANELDRFAGDENKAIEVGISPHAPYTVHPDLLAQCVKLSIKHEAPIAHHLAESREELALLRTGSGPFVKLLEGFDAWDPDAIPFGSRPLDYLQALAKSHRALVIHGNYLEDDEIEFVGSHADNMSIVYCPRTHAYFQHDAYPLAKMLAAGVNMAIGTDSRASNPDLSVLADMRFAAKQHPLLSPPTLLRMITLNAARALGLESEVGSLAPGKFADLAILTTPNHALADPHEMLFDSDCRIVGSMFRGRQQLRTEECPQLS